MTCNYQSHAQTLHTCEEGLTTFLVTRGGADLRFEITNLITEDIIIFT